MSDVARMLAGLLPEADDRAEFAAVYGGGFGPHAGAAVTRLLADWDAVLGDANDDWKHDAATLAARAWDLVQNDPHARAMVECVVLGVLGSCGLQFRSLFQADEEADTTAAERAWRRAIEAAVSRASTGTNLDAGAQLSRRDLVAQLLVSLVTSGEGFAIRTWRPRPGAAQAQCWRVIAAERVSNPDDRADDDRLYQGFRLDADGVAVGVYIRDRHPNALRGADKQTWTYVPMVAPNGQRNVLHLVRPLKPGARRGVSWFAPLIILAQHLAKTAEAFVVAKRIQACNAAVLRTDDPKALAAAAAVGSSMGPNLKWKPGMVAVTSRDNEVVFPQWQFQGADYQAFIDGQLRAFTACWGLPFQFVLQQLTDANLASAQVALDQADKTFAALQDLVITHVEQPIDDAIVREEIARGRLRLPTRDQALIMAGRYQRPRRADANRQRTRQAAQSFLDMGGSFSTAFSEMGYEFEDEIRQRAQDNAFMKAQGISVGVETVGEKVVSESTAKSEIRGDGQVTPDAEAGETGDASGDAEDTDDTDDKANAA